MHGDRAKRKILMNPHRVLFIRPTSTLSKGKVVTAKNVIAASLGCLFALMITQEALAEKPWPQAKEIRLVVPFPAGGGGDTLARVIAPELSARLGQTIIIENLAGAGGSLGTEQVARGKSDGYTLLYVTNGTMGTNPALYPNVGYDPLKDFAPVGQMTEIAMVMSVNPTRHKETKLSDFLDKARKSNTPYTFSSAGNGTTSHLAGVMLSNLTGIAFQHIPYRGGAASMTDMLGGRIDFTIDVAPNTLRHVDAKKLTALGSGSNQPLKSHPDIKPIQQTVPGFELFAWDGLVVKNGTDPEIIKKLNAALQDALKSESVKAAYFARGAEVVESTPDGFRVFMQSEAKKWADLVRSSKTKLD